MPIYEYECTSCHHHFDVIQKFNDAPITQCPACSKESVTKLMSAAGFQLKGTGWYVTDFKDKKKSDTTTKESKKVTTSGSDIKAESNKTTDSTTKENSPKTKSTTD